MWEAGVTVGIVYGVVFVRGIDIWDIVCGTDELGFCGWGSGDTVWKRRRRRRCRTSFMMGVFYCRYCYCLCVRTRFYGCPFPCGLAPAFACISSQESIICSSFFGIWRALTVSCRGLDTISYCFVRKHPDISFARVIKGTVYF